MSFEPVQLFVWLVWGFLVLVWFVCWFVVFVCVCLVLYCGNIMMEGFILFRAAKYRPGLDY